MLHLYNEKPISIFTIESDVKIRVQFCNVKMKMKPCQFKHFHKYLTNLSKKIDGSTSSVDLLLVRDNLNIIDKSEDIESLAMLEKDNGDVYFVPAFSGLFSPHWDETARGSLFGLTRFSNKSHIARAVIESVAFQTYELLESMEKDLDTDFESLKVDGGMVANNLLMQFQSDILDKSIHSQEINEITALGVGVASYLYVMDLPLSSMGNYITSSKTWNPNMSNETRINSLESWYKAIEKAKNWL